MSPRIRIILGLVVTGFLLGLPSLTRQLGTTSAQSPASQGGVVVLRSGQVLQGEVVRIDNRYGVRLGEGNELRVAATDVDFIATSMEDACQRKAARVRPGNVDDQLQLAEWCLRHGLIRQAAQSTTEALHLAPDDRRVKNLERRLNALVQTPTAAEPTPEASVERLSTSKLEQVTRELPAGAMQRFTTNVQPLLLNRCATSGCHGLRANSDYRLLRPALGQNASRRLTQQNLVATLAWIDRETPDDSSFLAHAKSFHGGQSKGTHAPLEQGQYEQMVDWVRQAIQPVSRIRPSTIDGVDPKLLQANPKAGSRRVDDADGAENPERSDNRSADEPGRSSSPAPRSADLVDPFDPEVFNRRNRKS